MPRYRMLEEEDAEHLRNRWWYRWLIGSVELLLLAVLALGLLLR
jgi:hypothetical protein